MNASKNCSDRYSGILLSGLKKLFCLAALLFFFCLDASAAELVKTPAETIGLTDYFKVLLGLLFVISLFLLSTFLFKRFNSGPMLGRGQLRVIDGLHLGSRERLMLVELKGKQHLLAITPGKINRIYTVDAEPSEEDVADASLEQAQNPGIENK